MIQRLALVQDIELSVDNVCWVRDAADKIHAAIFINLDFAVLTFKQCDVIFGERMREPEFRNEQRLANGIVVPIVPHEYVEHAKHRAVKRQKREAAAPRRPRRGALPELNRVIAYFNVDAAPTTEEKTESIALLPNDLLKSRTTLTPVTSQTKRDRVIGVLSAARDELLKSPLHAAHLNDSCIDEISSFDDLADVQIDGVQLLSIFNLLLPSTT